MPNQNKISKYTTKKAESAINPNTVFQNLDLIWDDLTSDTKEEVVKILDAALNYGMDRVKGYDMPGAYNGDEALIQRSRANPNSYIGVPRTSGKLAGADVSMGDHLRAQGIRPLF